MRDVPALTSLTAHSPGVTPCMSPIGPMHMVAATGFPVAFRTCTAHSASSTCSKYYSVKKTQQYYLLLLLLLLSPLKGQYLCSRNISVNNLQLLILNYWRSNLGNQEIHILLNEDVHLLLEDGLHFGLALATQVRGCLRDTASHQGVTLVGNLPGQVAGGLVNLLTLWSRTKS